MDRKRNGLVILGLLVVIAIIAGISFLMPKERTAPIVTVTDPGGLITTLAPETATPAPRTEETALPETEKTAEPEAEGTAAPEAEGTAAPEEEDGGESVEFAEHEAAEPRAWLLITVDEKTYAPYPLTKSGDYRIHQKSKNATNVIHVTEDSIQMASSTCDNQLCVTEGVVTLDNKASRILGNYIICLPNGVTLELLNAEEYAALTNGGQQGEV